MSLQEHVGEVEIGSRIVRNDANHFAELRFGRLKIRFAQVVRSKIVMGRIEIRGETQCLFIMTYGLVRLLLCVRFDALVECLNSVLWKMPPVLRRIN